MVDTKALFTSEKGNNYLLSRGIPQVLLVHPILNYLLSLPGKGIDLEEWMAGLEPGDIEIEEGLKASKEEIKYYYNYMLFLEKNDYFKGVKKHGLTENRYSPEFIKFQLANTQQIVYECTDACSLRCRYCGYGDLYTEYDKRDNKTLDIKIAKKIFDYMVELFQSPLNRRMHKRIFLSFYGGEPLVNMPFIKEMVRYAGGKKILHQEFSFSMTTNGVDLDKHMDFLVENDFRLLISLDGNEKHNVYRLFPDGSSSYKTVYDNAIKLKEKYPGYFAEKVDFNAVLHNKNSNKELSVFFKKHFGKDPIIAEIDRIGIKEEKKDEFDKIFKRIYTGLKPRDIFADIKDNDRILKTPPGKEIPAIYW